MSPAIVALPADNRSPDAHDPHITRPPDYVEGLRVWDARVLRRPRMVLRRRACVRWRALLAALVALGTGCRALPPGVVRHAAELQGGQLVICRLAYGPEHGQKVRPQVAACEYATLIYWPSDTSAPRLFIYDRPRKRVDEVCSFETFLELVDRLPYGAPVAWVNTCCAPISCGMVRENEARLRAVLARGGHTLLRPGDNRERAGHCDGLLICTCESVRMYLPGDRVHPNRVHGCAE